MVGDVDSWMDQGDQACVRTVVVFRREVRSSVWKNRVQGVLGGAGVGVLVF